jgi:hypothetical protein
VCSLIGTAELRRYEGSSRFIVGETMGKHVETMVKPTKCEFYNLLVLVTKKIGSLDDLR